VGALGPVSSLYQTFPNELRRPLLPSRWAFIVDLTFLSNGIGFLLPARCVFLYNGSSDLAPSGRSLTVPLFHFPFSAGACSEDSLRPIIYERPPRFFAGVFYARYPLFFYSSPPSRRRLFRKEHFLEGECFSLRGFLRSSRHFSPFLSIRLF